MEYTIKVLASMAGVTTKTLRHYEEVGLLSPKRSSKNGYRIYGKEEVHRLQEILFYKALEMPLEDIGKILQDKAFDRRQTLQMHKRKLQEKKSADGGTLNNHRQQFIRDGRKDSDERSRQV